MPIDPKYELLPDTFTKKDRHYTVLARTDTVILCQVAVEGTIRYESWIRRFSNGWSGIIKGKPVTFAPKEVFPPDAAFGNWAWCDITLPAAQKRYAGLIQAPAAVEGIPVPLFEDRE